MYVFDLTFNDFNKFNKYYYKKKYYDKKNVNIIPTK